MEKIQNRGKKIVVLITITILISVMSIPIFATNNLMVSRSNCAEGNCDFLEVAQQCKVKVMKYRYGQVNTVPSINGRIDCSSYVCYSLYKYRNYRVWRNST